MGLDVYDPRNKNRHKFTGGSFGEIYRNVVKRARNFIKSPQGQKIKGIKGKKILQIGANAVDNILSGQSSFQSLKSAKKKIKKKLSTNDLNRFKKSILKKGGLTLYRLNKRKGKRKKKKKSGKKKSSSLETFYRLSNLSSKLKSRSKKKPLKKLRKRRRLLKYRKYRRKKGKRRKRGRKK